MAVCDFCNQDMLTADSCTAHLIVYQTGERLKAIKFGEEQDAGREPGERCHDCNVEVGAFHHPNCDMEQCPRCGGQLISCRCSVEAFVEDAPTAPVTPSMSVKELEMVGGFPYRVFEKDAAQKPAPAPFPPPPLDGNLIASGVVFPGIGTCDIWLTEDIATHDAQLSLADGSTAEFARCYSPGLSKHSFATGYSNERNEYITQVAVQLRVRPGSEEAKVVLEVISILAQPKNEGN